MAKVKISELRTLQAVELQQRATDLRRELGSLHMKARQGAVEQPHRIRQMRRDVARLLTILGQQPRTSAQPAKVSA